MPTSVLAQISDREISRREIFFLEPENFFRLLGAIPDLQAHVSGKDVLLAFTHQVGKAL